MGERAASALLALVSLLIALALAEWGARLYFGDALGWRHESPLPERVARARAAGEQGERVVAVFGDSIVEYFRDSPANMVEVANRRVAARGESPRFVNFGFSGSSIPDYIAKFERVAPGGLLDGAIFVIYTGNDYHGYDFWLRSGVDLSRPARERAHLHLGRNDGVVIHWLKRSVFLRLLWRAVKRELGLFTAESLLDHARRAAREVGVPAAEVERRHQQLDPALVRRADRDEINKSLVAHALIDPRMYARIRWGFGDHETEVSEALRRDIDELAQLCRRHAVPCGVLFVDGPLFVDESRHPFFRAMGVQLPAGIIGEPHHTTLLKGWLPELGLPFMESREVLAGRDAYLPDDDHPNERGHELIGELLPRLEARLR